MTAGRELELVAWLADAMASREPIERAFRAAVLRAREAGASAGEIATAAGISVRRVYQILEDGRA